MKYLPYFISELHLILIRHNNDIGMLFQRFDDTSSDTSTGVGYSERENSDIGTDIVISEL